MKKDLTGKKFGRLTVLKFDEFRNKRAYWICKCDCENIRSIIGSSLTFEHTKSCGCLKKELFKQLITTHGMRQSREYSTWCSLKRRCLNPNDKRYKDWGGRGIEVCKRWLKFENFYEDMGDCPKGFSIDRLDNNLGYSKKNCAWRSAKDQSRNTRKNINITYKGKTQCLSAWSEELDIKYATLWYRIKNWSIEKAFKFKV